MRYDDGITCRTPIYHVRRLQLSFTHSRSMIYYRFCGFYYNTRVVFKPVEDSRFAISAIRDLRTRGAVVGERNAFS
jgi:hypothetical protein